MSYPEGDPGEWKESERRDFLLDKIWKFDFDKSIDAEYVVDFLGRRDQIPCPEMNAKDAQELRCKLVEMGYSINLDCAKRKVNYKCVIIWL